MRRLVVIPGRHDAQSPHNHRITIQNGAAPTRNSSMIPASWGGRLQCRAISATEFRPHQAHVRATLCERWPIPRAGGAVASATWWRRGGGAVAHGHP
jgi:hypothetical protein